MTISIADVQDAKRSDCRLLEAKLLNNLYWHPEWCESSDRHNGYELRARHVHKPPLLGCGTGRRQMECVMSAVSKIICVKENNRRSRRSTRILRKRERVLVRGQEASCDRLVSRVD